MRKQLVVLLFVEALICGAPQKTFAQAEPFIGQIAAFAFGFCPRGWAPTKGQLLPIAQNTALFSLLGTTYGGNGQTTFALPNLPAASTLTSGALVTQCIALQGIYPSRE